MDSVTDSCIIGSNCLCQNDGCFLASDDSPGGTTLTSANDDECLFRYANGMTVYTAHALGTGVTIGSGGGSWSSVCDVNKKDNLIELDYKNILEKVNQLPIYQFNYKSNPSQQVNYGTTAQSFHKQFPDEKKDGKHTKNQLVIESMDAIGLCMASIRGLKEIIESQQKEIDMLKKSSSIDILNEFNRLKDRVRILELS